MHLLSENAQIPSVHVVFLGFYFWTIGHIDEVSLGRLVQGRFTGLLSRSLHYSLDQIKFLNSNQFRVTWGRRRFVAERSGLSDRSKV